MFKRKSLTVLTAVIILTLAVIAPFFGVKISTPDTAEAAEAEKVNQGFVYKDETKREISGFTLPESVKGDFEVVIPEGVTAIGDNAFNDLSALVGVTLNKELKSIGDLAFAKTSLTYISIPKTVTKIGEHAFNGCANLAGVEFENGRSEALTVSSFAFADCKTLPALNIPDKTTVGQYAFEGCTSLLWVNVGNNCLFRSTSGADDPTAVFFPENISITIIFPSKSEYNKMLSWQEETFKQKHSAFATYIVEVNCYIGESSQPAMVYKRLHGKSFNFVPNSSGGEWNTDSAYSSLPVQDAAYSSTTWYGDSGFKTAVDYNGVNKLLETESEINLYCRETVSVPVFPAEPVSWVYKKDTSYDINNVSEVLKALGCEQEFTEEQLKAFDFTVAFADEKGNAAETPEAINGNGVYSVKFSLKPEFGSWAQDVTSSITVNVNTNGFTTVMIVLLVIGVLAVIITVSTAIIRKKVQQRNKKKQLTQQEVIEKFKAAGGETTLK